jgi:hypothetical protein
VSQFQDAVDIGYVDLLAVEDGDTVFAQFAHDP